MTPAFVSAVETHFKTNMTTGFPAVPLFFSNVHVADTMDTFAVLHIIPGETLQNCINPNSSSRNVGIIQIDVFTPKDEGAGEALNTSYAAGNFFRRLSLSTTEGLAQFKDPTVVDRGEVRGRHKHMATIPYHYDFTPA